MNFSKHAKLVIYSAIIFGFTVILFKYTFNNSENIKERTINAHIPCNEKTCSIPDEVKGELTIFIFAGQSNMSGRGEMSNLPADLRSHPRVFLFGNDYQWKTAYEPHDDATGQIDKVSEDSNAGVSMAMSFAIRLFEHYPDMYVGLVPCSKGGSVIEQWQKNLSHSTLYGSCLNRAKKSIEMGYIAAILFAQGESDARDPEKDFHPKPSPNTWGSKFTEFATNFRVDLGMPDVSLIYTQIGNHDNPKLFRYWETVRSQQAVISLPNTYMIKTRDLPLKDYVHYTTHGFITMGRRFADRFVEIRNKHLAKDPLAHAE